MTTLPVLYSYRRCPYAMRARMALSNSGIEVQIREISLREKPQSMLDASPKGTVPVLVLPTGEVIDQSLDIMKWALSKNDKNCWVPEGNQAKVEALIQINDGDFKKRLDQYKYPERYQAIVEDVLQEAIRVQIEPMNTLLDQNEFLLGYEMTLADVAIFPFIRQFSMVDPAWFENSGFNSLKRWLKCFLESELFTSVMAKYPVWKDEPK